MNLYKDKTLYSGLDTTFKKIYTSIEELKQISDGTILSAIKIRENNQFERRFFEDKNEFIVKQADGLRYSYIHFDFCKFGFYYWKDLKVFLKDRDINALAEKQNRKYEW